MKSKVGEEGCCYALHAGLRCVLHIVQPTERKQTESYLCNEVRTITVEWTLNKSKHYSEF